MYQERELSLTLDPFHSLHASYASYSYVVRQAKTANVSSSVSLLCCEAGWLNAQQLAAKSFVD